MKAYLDLMRHVLEHGHRKSDPPAPTLSTFGWQMRFDLAAGSLLTTKKVHFKWSPTSPCGS
jgi:thymidylate synthase